VIGQPPVFVDSAAWVALIDASDRQHAAAAAYWRQAIDQSRRFVTSDYVLDETFTLLRRRPHGLAMAVAVHDVLESSHFVEQITIDASLRRRAWDLFTSYQDKVLSFTDCTSFALMHHHGLHEAFTFDGDFQRVGFATVPAL
jgi:hypothetical protein